MSLDLLWGHVSQGTRGPLCVCTERGGAVSDGGYAKIREQHLLVLPDQYILRLDIAMDKFLFMRILQGCCHLLHIEIEHAHNRRMRKGSNGFGFLLEVLGLLTAQMSMQHLDGRLLLEPHMLSEVDLSIATLSQQADQAVVTKLLSNMVCHLWPPPITFEAQMKLQVYLLCSSKNTCIVEDISRQVKQIFRLNGVMGIKMLSAAKHDSGVPLLLLVFLILSP